MINPQKPVINPITNFNRFTALLFTHEENFRAAEWRVLAGVASYSLAIFLLRFYGDYNLLINIILLNRLDVVIQAQTDF